MFFIPAPESRFKVQFTFLISVSENDLNLNMHIEGWRGSPVTGNVPAVHVHEFPYLSLFNQVK